MHSSTYARWQDLTDAERDGLAKSFREADPSRHLVLADFLGVGPEAVMDRFPPLEWSGWHQFPNSQAGERYCQDITAIPNPFRSIIYELSSPPFLRFLETVTGVESLIPDPYLDGGGLQCGGAGIFAPDTDSHPSTRLDLYRRVKVLVYLTPEWDDAWGGSLELRQRGDDRPFKEVVPHWGTFVVVPTDDRSMYAFSNPVSAAGVTRPSLALSYYTSARAEGYGGDRAIDWERHAARTRAELLQVQAGRTLVKASRRLATVAAKINTNLARTTKADDGDPMAIQRREASDG